MGRVALGNWPAFPPELLHSLREAGGELPGLRFALLDGSVVAATGVVAETASGIILETADKSAVAVPWYAILRVDRLEGEGGRTVGFRTRTPAVE